MEKKWMTLTEQNTLNRFARSGKTCYANPITSIMNNDPRFVVKNYHR